MGRQEVIIFKKEARKIKDFDEIFEKGKETMTRSLRKTKRPWRDE